MQCPQCEAEIDGNSIFCPKCGVRLSGEQAAGPNNDEAPRERFLAAAADKQADADEPEDELWEGSYAKQAMASTWLGATGATLGVLILAALFGASGAVWGWLLIGLVLLWAGLVCLYLYRRHSVRYRLTNHRLLYDEGILSRRRERLELIDVDDVTVFQGPIERLVGVGRIVIHSSDATDGTLQLTGIESARVVADTIDDARRRERRRRGLHIESV